MTDTEVTVTLRRTIAVQGRQAFNEVAFVGVRGPDPKVVLGSTGTDAARTRAKLTATDKTVLEANERLVRVSPPEPMAKAQEITTRVTALQLQAGREQDAQKKQAIQKDLAAAREDADAKTPALYREVVEKHADSPAALDAAMNLLRAGERAKLTPDEAARLVAVVEKQAAPYGPAFVRSQMTPALTAQQGALSRAGKADEAAAVGRRVGELELAAIEATAKRLTDTDPPATQARVLAGYLAALEKAGKADEAKAVATRLAKLDAKLDEEYLAKALKPAAFAGRKDKSANKVVVMELFTGAQCPPCVAADVAFDALCKAYKPTDLVLVQYHMHIPGPDPMTNPDTVARWDYYSKLHAGSVRGVPCSLFGGKVAGGTGGAMAQSEAKYNQYVGVVDPLAEQSTAVKVTGKATRTGDKVDIAVEVDGAEGEDLKLRLLLVEDEVRFAGGNGIRFHHHVVRAMPGGAAGLAVKDKASRHTASADVGEVRKGLDKYLADFAANTRPFPQPGRPMEMKHLKVVALVQNDKTGEILQAAQLDVEGAAAGR